MIVTVTLNPAVNHTLDLERFVPDDTNRVRQSRIDPGGKGINVSRVLRELERESTAAGVADCLTTGTQLCRRADVERILPDVRVKQSRSAVTAGGDGGSQRQ